MLHKIDNLAGNRVAPERCFPEHFFSAITKHSGAITGDEAMIKPGEKYGRLTVLEEAGRTNSGRLKFKCLCDCGNEKIAESSNIERGTTSSCGCYRTEFFTKHGMVDTPEWHTWCAMRDRCQNENNAKYPRYGGRGITVCDRWLESFNNFFDDMGEKPGGEYSIERTNNDGDYKPENCKWATPKEQSLNKSNNRNITFNGETHPVAEWERICGFKPKTINSRLNYGWTPERAITEPINKTNRWYSNELQEGTT